jgi:putative hydrolase of the HAD superfamily
MNASTSIKALILDFGEVLVRPQSDDSIRGMAQSARLDVDEFRRRYWHHRPGYDAGRLSGTEYWQLVLGVGTVPNVDPEREAIAALKEADCTSWTDYRPDMWELVAEFRERHGRTAFLSNGVPEVMSRVRAEKALSEYFDAVVVSYEVGCAKPDARIYQLCLSALGVPAESALFVDDRRANLDAAERLGMQVFHFTGDSSVAELRSRLAQAPE